MIRLLPLTLLCVALVTQNPIAMQDSSARQKPIARYDTKPPDEFNNLPRRIRNRTTVVLTGKFRKDKVHVQRSNGMLAWILTAGFDIEAVYKGDVGSDYVGINGAMLPDSKYVRGTDWKEGRRYMVALRPASDSSEILRTGEGAHYYTNALSGREIVAVVELYEPNRAKQLNKAK